MNTKKLLLAAALIFLATACGSKTTSTSTSSGTSDSGTASITPLQITEWGVELTPVQSISDLRYMVDPNHADTIIFSSASLISLDQQTGGSGCSLDKGPLGAISRVVDFSPYTSSTHGTPRNIKIGTYYYYYTTQAFVCSTNPAVQNLESLQSADLNNAFSSLAEIPKSK